MGLAKLIDEAHQEPIHAGNITFRLPEAIRFDLDSLAEEIGVSRSSVIREALVIGLARLRADWERAQVPATKKKGTR